MKMELVQFVRNRWEIDEDGTCSGLSWLVELVVLHLSQSLWKHEIVLLAVYTLKDDTKNEISGKLQKKMIKMLKK